MATSQYQLDIQYQLDHRDDYIGHKNIITHSVILPITIVAVVLRLLSRRICKARLLADDVMILIALVREICFAFHRMVIDTLAFPFPVCLQLTFSDSF